jgi:hypothetical protein
MKQEMNSNDNFFRHLRVTPTSSEFEVRFAQSDHVIGFIGFGRRQGGFRNGITRIKEASIDGLDLAFSVSSGRFGTDKIITASHSRTAIIPFGETGRRRLALFEEVVSEAR